MLLTLAVEAVKKAPKDGEGVKSGPLGLAVILLLCVAVYFLFKSMSKHMKRVREDFPTSPAKAGPTTSTTRSVPESAARRGDSTQPAEPGPAAPASAPPPPDPE